jgi:hypothetical protein
MVADREQAGQPRRCCSAGCALGSALAAVAALALASRWVPPRVANEVDGYLRPRVQFLYDKVTGDKCEWPAQRHLPAHAHFQRAAVSMCAIIKDESAYAHEWATFHFAQGVSRITLWDDNSTDLQDTLASLATLRATGQLEVYSDTDIVARAQEWAAAVEHTRAEWAREHGSGPGAPQMCGPTDAELAAMRQHADECVTTRGASNHVTCQIVVFRLCAAWAKLLGDGYHVLIDVDEFLWSPPRGGCWAGGCPVSASNAPLVEAGSKTLLDGLREYLDGPVGRLFASLAIRGGMYGPSHFQFANWSDPNPATGLRPLVTETHVWSATYDDYGYATPLTGCSDVSECEAVTGSAYPQKSALSIRNNPRLPIEGIAIHRHAVGTQRDVAFNSGETLRYNHYSYLRCVCGHCAASGFA